MYEGVDTVVLDEELAYQDIVPLVWRPATTPPIDSDQDVARNVRLLEACAVLEEQGTLEKPDDNSPHSADILRLDMKLNLLLDLVGRILAANQSRPNPVPLRFNALGATWNAAASSIKSGDEGTLEIYLKDCFVEPLRLAGKIANVTAEGQIKVKFAACGEAVADLIEKLAFRRHRRQVADARQPRVGDTARGGKIRR